MLRMIQDQIAIALKGCTDPQLLLACSGGVDSMVLLDLLQKSHYTFGVAHCNFGLRSSASDLDAQMVEHYCSTHQIPFLISSFPTAEQAKREGVSIQMAARQLRYSWLSDIIATQDYTHIVTAHHLDDQLETFLINTGRGTGLKGLRGILSNSILRPLLQVSKQEILTYAQNHDIQWREDSSNAKDDYLRNTLRHRIIPLWKQAVPDLLTAVKRTFRHYALAEEALAFHVQKFKITHFITQDESTSIAIDALNVLVPRAYYLHALFSPYGFHHSDDLEALLDTQSGKYLTSETHRLIRDRNSLLLGPKPTEKAKEVYWTPYNDLTTPCHLSLETVHRPSKDTAVLDPSLLKYPLILRKFRKGDYFYPIGMHGKKKLSKFFKDEKYSMLEKENQWLLCSEDNIVWVIGQRIDSRFAASASTQTPLMIKYH